jgi:phosphoenolpyruvate carboxykinase (ATP)
MQATESNDHNASKIHSDLSKLGLNWLSAVSWNDEMPLLMESAIAANEAQLSSTGGLVAKTGEHTGRSPKDKFIVLDAKTADTVWWANNQQLSRAQFDLLKADFLTHVQLKKLYVQDLEACADPLHALPARIITEFAWHALFMRHLLKPATHHNFKAQLTIINLPSFKAVPDRHGTKSETVIAFDLANNLVLIGGTAYAGEMKKAVFTVLNYLLPELGILPMHCSANIGADSKSAIFFGLSGTGKTTLSADSKRSLIGDDEHGWGENGIFNFENGCYAKAINLSQASEPDIYNAANQFGSVLENVVVDTRSRKVDFHDISLTENTRAAYPLSTIANASRTRLGPVPFTLIMLTADAFGVLPPIAKLTHEQAVQMFLIGYTAKIAGTERGVKTPEATFSACFGAPFLPRHPNEYARLLKDKLAKSDVSCFLVNTGWTGGGYGKGQRFPLAATRKLLDAALSGALNHVAMRKDDFFDFEVPIDVDGVDSRLLRPRECWRNKDEYDIAARKLKTAFDEARRKYVGDKARVALAAE